MPAAETTLEGGLGSIKAVFDATVGVAPNGGHAAIRKCIWSNGPISDPIPSITLSIISAKRGRPIATDGTNPLEYPQIVMWQIRLKIRIIYDLGDEDGAIPASIDYISQIEDLIDAAATVTGAYIIDDRLWSIVIPSQNSGGYYGFLEAETTCEINVLRGENNG